MRPPALALLALLLPLAARATVHRRLSASLFGETVGEVRLTLDPGVLTYRSQMTVVRDKVRLRQTAFLQSRFDPATGALLHSVARRCSGPDRPDAELSCGPSRTLLAPDGAPAPALAAETLLARSPGPSRCLAVVDEESGQRGEACAIATRTAEGVRLDGVKLGLPFRALVVDGLVVELELPDQGARFAEAGGAVEVSDEDLFAAPIPASGDAAAAVRHGVMRLRVLAPPESLARLALVTAPGQSVLEGQGGPLRLEVRRVEPPRTRRTRGMLDRAALLVAQARGSHVDCQTATQWFLEQARSRRWKVLPAIGFAFVDGRFAFHEWAVIQTPDGPVPVDPLLAQVPADAGHVQLSSSEASTGALLVEFRRGLSLEVE